MTMTIRPDWTGGSVPLPLPPLPRECPSEGNGGGAGEGNTEPSSWEPADTHANACAATALGRCCKIGQAYLGNLGWAGPSSTHYPSLSLSSIPTEAPSIFSFGWDPE